MTSIYDKYKNTNEWAIIEQAINELVENKDLQLTTLKDLVIGYITKQIVDNEEKPRSFNDQ